MNEKDIKNLANKNTNVNKSAGKFLGVLGVVYGIASLWLGHKGEKKDEWRAKYKR